jgi:hypothetical protein
MSWMERVRETDFVGRLIDFPTIEILMDGIVCILLLRAEVLYENSQKFQTEK